jgi:hypothetical protein
MLESQFETSSLRMDALSPFLSFIVAMNRFLNLSKISRVTLCRVLFSGCKPSDEKGGSSPGLKPRKSAEINEANPVGPMRIGNPQISTDES